MAEPAGQDFGGKAELARILASVSFVKAFRLCALLTYIVEQSLATHTDELTEQQIGINVFGRAAGFNSAEEKPAARVTIEQAESELLRGKPFQQVATCYSDCKGIGGSVGWVHRRVMVQEFEDAVFALQTVQRSKIFRTIFGLHLAPALRRCNAGVTPFSEVRLQIAKHMFLQLRQQALQQALAQIRAESDIHFSEEAALA